MLAVYIRVSTHEQNLEVQRSEVQRWIDQQRIDRGAVLWFEDKQTGKNLKRPGFEQLQRAIFAGDVDTVIVWKLDRLARSFRDGVKVVSDWIDRNVRLVSVTQAIDLSGVMGQMIAGVLFAFAEMELNVGKERQAAGIAAAKRRGAYKGRKVGTVKGSPARARELQARGFTVEEIATALKVKERTVFRYLRA